MESPIYSRRAPGLSSVPAHCSRLRLISGTGTSVVGPPLVRHAGGMLTTKLSPSSPGPSARVSAHGRAQRPDSKNNICFILFLTFLFFHLLFRSVCRLCTECSRCLKFELKKNRGVVVMHFPNLVVMHLSDRFLLAFFVRNAILLNRFTDNATCRS